MDSATNIITPTTTIQTKATTEGGSSKLWIYLIDGIIIFILFVGLVLVIFFAIKYRPRNVYLPKYPIPQNEVYIVMLDEGGISHLVKNEGGIDKGNTGADGKPLKYNVHFSNVATSVSGSGDTTLGFFDVLASDGTTISSYGYMNAAVNALKKQAFKYAFGDDKGADKISLATKEQVESALANGANWNDKNAKNVYRITNYNRGYNPLLNSNEDKKWEGIVYTKDGLHLIDDSKNLSTVYNATNLPTTAKVFAVAFYGPKQPPTDYNSRQYYFEETYNSETPNKGPNGEDLLNAPLNSARPTITFRGTAKDLTDKGYSSGSFIFRFRILPFNETKWSSVYGDDFRSQITTPQ